MWRDAAELSPVILSVLTFLLGLFLGNRLALGRERRIEFNAAATPVRAWLLKEIKQPVNPSRWPEAIELDTLTSCLSAYRRRAFVKTCAGLASAQHAARVQDPKTGSISYPDTSQIQVYLEKLLPYTSRR